MTYRYVVLNCTPSGDPWDSYPPYPITKNYWPLRNRAQIFIKIKQTFRHRTQFNLSVTLFTVNIHLWHIRDGRVNVNDFLDETWPDSSIIWPLIEMVAYLWIFNVIYLCLQANQLKKNRVHYTKNILCKSIICIYFYVHVIWYFIIKITAIRRWINI